VRSDTGMHSPDTVRFRVSDEQIPEAVRDARLTRTVDDTNTGALEHDGRSNACYSRRLHAE